MIYRTFSKVIFSCFFLASCASSNNIMPSSVPTQSKKTEKQKEFNFENQDAASLVRLAKGFKQSGDLVSALNFYGQASVVNPNILEPWLGIIELLREFDNPVGARNAIRDARRYHANDPDLALIAAEIEIIDDKAADAITILSPHMVRKDYRFSNLIGVASEMMGSPTIARKYYNEAIGYNAAASGITDNLALSFSFYNDHKTAIAILQKNLKGQNNRKLSYETLAIIYAMDNQLDAALNIARTILSDEEVSNNYPFYKALHKLPPAMRARAVFTRSIPVDANPYLQENMQELSDPVQKPAETENTNDLTKAEMARQLVNRRNQVNAVKSPETTPQQAAIERAEKSVEIINQEVDLPVSSPVNDAQAIVGNSLTEEDKSISTSAVENILEPEEKTAEAIVPEKEIKPLAEKIIPKEKTEPIAEIIIPEDKNEPLAEEKSEPKAEQNVPEMGPESNIKENTHGKTAETTTEAGEPDEKAELDDVQSLLDVNELKESAPEARDAYRVQIAAYTNILDAQKDWCRISKRVIAAEIYEQPNVRIIGEGSDTRYRLLLGEYDNRADADATCESLKTQKLGCYVVKGAGQLRPLESDCKR